MDECLELWLRVQPGPGKGSVVGRYGNRIKIRVAAPAVDGKANVALIRFLAREFGVKQGQVRLADGARSRNKRVVIDGPAKRPAWWTGTAATRNEPAGPDLDPIGRSRHHLGAQAHQALDINR